MTQIEQIRQEIERLKSQLVRGACAAGIAMETNCKEEAYNEVLAFIDSIPAETASPELDSEIFAWQKGHATEDTAQVIAMTARHFAEWQNKQDDELLVIAHLDGVAAGREAEKKEMMKEAVEGHYMKTIDGKCYVESSIFSPDGFVRVGGKVKLIILKGDD